MKDRIIVGGCGPAAINFCRYVVKFASNPNSIYNLKPYIPPATFKLLERSLKKINHETPEFIIVTNSTIGGKSKGHVGGGNQHIAIWGGKFDELKPFEYSVDNFAQPTPVKKLGWALDQIEIVYDSPYCAIYHGDMLKTFYNEYKEHTTFKENTQIIDVISTSKGVKVITDKGEIEGNIFVDAMGYNSILNQKYHLNNKSPVYQMLIWKYSEIKNLDMNIDYIVYRPQKFYEKNDRNDHVLGWIHPENDGVIIGASKYSNTAKPWDEIDKELTHYVEDYIKINNFQPVGEKKIHHELGVLYNPHHKLKQPFIIQVGDAAKIDRPTTGYGWIPALWHSLYQAMGYITGNDKFGMKLFNSHFMFSYSWEYVCQRMFMDGPWTPNVDQIFSTVDGMIKQFGNGFIDRLTLTQFTKDDLNFGIKFFIKTVIKNKIWFKGLSWDTWRNIIKFTLINRWINLKKGIEVPFSQELKEIDSKTR